MSKILKALERKDIKYFMGGVELGTGTLDRKDTVYKEECWEFQAVFGMSSMPWSIETLLSVSLDQPCSLFFSHLSHDNEALC